MTTPALIVQVKEAIAHLAERKGSSRVAIKTAIESKTGQQMSPMRNKAFLTALRKGVTDGGLLQVKGHYKLSIAAKKSAKKKKKVVKKKKAIIKKKKPVVKRKKKKTAKKPATSASKKISASKKSKGKTSTKITKKKSAAAKK